MRHRRQPRDDQVIAFNKSLAAWALTILLCLTTGQAMASKVGDKAALQAAMQQHIDRNLVDGTYLYLDEMSGKVQPLYPQKAHPVILRMGDYFILCSDFRDASNAAVNIDFYLARNGDKYVVFHKSMDNDKLVHRLISEGKAEPLN